MPQPDRATGALREIIAAARRCSSTTTSTTSCTWTPSWTQSTERWRTRGELHGSVLRNRCRECGMPHDVAAVVAGATSPDGVPRCQRCGGVVKPDVVVTGWSSSTRTPPRTTTPRTSSSAPPSGRSSAPPRANGPPDPGAQRPTTN